ncbi:MAG: transposase [Prevotella sp.]|nr:transposase [Prevotella sp.]
MLQIVDFFVGWYYNVDIKYFLYLHLAEDIMYIEYVTIRGKCYASVTESVRLADKDNKKRKGSPVAKGKTIYLGRVIDKERHIYKNRERGMYTYDLETDTYGPVPDDFTASEEPKKRVPARRPASPAFGDIFVCDEIIKKYGFNKSIDAICFPNPDTIRALLGYYIVSKEANCHAETWYESSYAQYLYPNAQMASQRISEALSVIGSEDAKQAFFKEYLRFLDLNKENFDNTPPASSMVKDCILIDSTGLSSAIKFPLTAMSNHNGIINEEIRLIYVVQRSTSMPMFFRYVAGNVIDATTIARTIAELKAYGVEIGCAILDAGYYTGPNADILIAEKIPFVSRVRENMNIYKNTVAQYRDGIESCENMVRFNGRVLYVKCVPVRIGSKADHDAYAYLCLDINTRGHANKDTSLRANEQKMTDEELFDELHNQGFFVIISTLKLPVTEILPLYYQRDRIEKIFELAKENAGLLPLNVQTEESFRGHLLMTFMATALLELMSQNLKKAKISVDSALSTLSNHRVDVYDEWFVTREPVKKMNQIYKALKIKCPISIERNPN